MNPIRTYIQGFPPDVRKLLLAVYAAIRSAAPQAKDDMRYGMPTLRLNGKNLIHFAAFTAHIGLYPTPSAIARFRNELSGYTTSKGAIQFPLTKRIPLSLIKRITAFRVKEVTKGD